MESYRAFLSPLMELHVPARALGLGGDRPAWLHWLTAAGFEVQGLPRPQDGHACDPQHAEALTHLHKLPDESLSLLSVATLIEHCSPAQAHSLIEQAWRVLRPGGLLLIETCNPEHLAIVHGRPAPIPLRPWTPLALDAIVQLCGFERRKIMRTDAAGATPAIAPTGLLGVLGAGGPDYAIVAQKSGPGAQSQRFDDAFAADYGASLHELAQRYDRQQARSRSATELLAERAGHGMDINMRHHAAAEAELKALAQRLAHTESQLLQADARSARMEAHSAHLDAALDRLQHHVATLEDRQAARRYLARFVGAMRQGRIASGLKRRARQQVLRVIRAMLARPHWARRARDLLVRVSPRLAARLQALWTHERAIAHLAQLPSADLDATHLPERAAALYEQLKRAIDGARI